MVSKLLEELHNSANVNCSRDITSVKTIKGRNLSPSFFVTNIIILKYRLTFYLLLLYIINAVFQQWAFSSVG